MSDLKKMELPDHPFIKKVVFGRKAPVAQCPHMKLRNYLGALPAPPATCDYSPKGGQTVSNVYLNDRLGDCVVAGYYHIVGIETGNATGMPFVVNSQQLIADYSAIGGYVPGNPSTDNGCDEQTALNYWTQHGGANGTKILGWLAINPANKQEVQTAMWLFENLYFGVGLPDAWINPIPSANGFVWGMAGAANPNNGHAFIGVGYNANGIKIDTWGMLGTMTYEAVAQYCAQTAGGALYVILTPDQIAKTAAKTPNGLSWYQLVSDFDAMGGHVPLPPVPPPSPSPDPSPQPSVTVVTLEQAKAWVTAGLQQAPWYMVRCLAPKYACAGLDAKWPK